MGTYRTTPTPTPTSAPPPAHSPAHHPAALQHHHRHTPAPRLPGPFTVLKLSRPCTATPGGSPPVAPLEEFIDHPRDVYAGLRESGSVFAAELAPDAPVHLSPLVKSRDLAGVETGARLLVAIKSVALIPDRDDNDEEGGVEQKLVDVRRELEVLWGLCCPTPFNRSCALKFLSRLKESDAVYFHCASGLQMDLLLNSLPWRLYSSLKLRFYPSEGNLKDTWGLSRERGHTKNIMSQGNCHSYPPPSDLSALDRNTSWRVYRRRSQITTINWSCRTLVRLSRRATPALPFVGRQLPHPHRAAGSCTTTHRSMRTHPRGLDAIPSDPGLRRNVQYLPESGLSRRHRLAPCPRLKDFSLTRRLLSAHGHVVPDPHAAGTTPMTECSPAFLYARRDGLRRSAKRAFSHPYTGLRLMTLERVDGQLVTRLQKIFSLSDLYLKRNRCEGATRPLNIELVLQKVKDSLDRPKNTAAARALKFAVSHLPHVSELGIV
ncbi:hypothetical protein C8J57DRAFT_1726768 [Mycena rebaudengoi]|nr:hypothetical protein C8J57DRAFT_1726768 [Mycena rebaudengoi]